MKQTEQPQLPSWWRRWQSGQAFVEYWPTIPAAIMIMIAAAALVMPLGNMFETTANGLTGVECDAPASGPTFTDLDGGHRIEVTSSVYDPDEDRTTVSFQVSSGDSPAISHWVLGIDEDTADRIVSSSEAYQDWGLDPKTGKSGIKFDIGYGGGGSTSSNSFGEDTTVLASLRFAPSFNTYVEEREIVLTFTGRVDFVEYVDVEVTTKSGGDVASGYVTVPPASGAASGGDCASADSSSLGNA